MSLHSVRYLFLTLALLMLATVRAAAQPAYLLHELSGHKSAADTLVALSADGKMAISSCPGELTLLWDVASGKQLAKLPYQGLGSRSAPTARCWLAPARTASHSSISPQGR